MSGPLGQESFTKNVLGGDGITGPLTPLGFVLVTSSVFPLAEPRVCSLQASVYFN